MIEQIALPSRAYLKRTRARIPHLMGSSWPPTREMHEQDADALEKKIGEAEAKIDAMKADGWEIIGFSPFTEGEGVNFVLYKAPAKDSQFDTPLKDFMQVQPQFPGLIEFAREVDPHYKAEPFHEAMAAALEDVAKGKINRLMLIVPPSHGASHLVAEIFPAYWKRCHPIKSQVLVATDTNHIAGARKRAAEAYGADVHATMVRGGITGITARLGIIDNPVRSAETGQNAPLRQEIWGWYKSVFSTRMQPDAPIVIVTARSHKNDLVGTLAHSGQDWTILRFPAIAESQEERDRNNTAFGLLGSLPDPINRQEGEPLAPSMVDKETLISLRAAIGNAEWNTMYQGVPED